MLINRAVGPDRYYLALDLETTGLGFDQDNPSVDLPHTIVEAAAILVDQNLDEVSSFTTGAIAITAAERAAMSPFVIDMHTRTGLLEEIDASALTLERAESAFLAWLTEGQMISGALLFGSTIEFDSGFLRRRMPKMYGHLGYRLFNASSWLERLRDLRPDLVEGNPWRPAYEAEQAERGETATAHRALADIRHSLAMQRHFEQGLGLLPRREGVAA